MLLRDTYVEINLDHLIYNLKNIRRYIGEDVAIGAVVKANGYGHGAVEISKTIMENGGDYLVVATLTEGLELRKIYPDYKIFIMGYTPDEYLEYVVDNNIIQCIFSLKQAIILNDLSKLKNKKTVVHIKYDTGFNRLGYRDCQESIDEIIKIFKYENIIVEGIFSHLALAGDEENKKQFNAFMNAITKIESSGNKLKYKHICDSISAIDYPEFNLNMIRPGAILYGLKSFRKNDIDLKQVLTFKSKIYYIKKIKKGEGISYNYKWKANRDSIIATIPVGYSDGYPRNMAEVGVVTIKGHRVPVVGVICMDQCMVDVTDIPCVKEGDEVVIYGDGNNNSLTIEEVSKLGRTNKNEIISRITRRTPRVYIKNNKVHKILNYLY
ncbi:MAG: alanine racemase [Anaeromicrobium sp.]|jgi:alanine racemase|uniref:alanine racemase n=1 Tax=Anaeromicrobium sp. TaxID=1929132 RepID=UPI0025DED200|nr:alanine racemase [Anaeromicrobium sp.]MCT4595527.1 alanine racemase [Anaeromicrobium sp.]